MHSSSSSTKNQTSSRIKQQKINNRNSVVPTSSSNNQTVELITHRRKPQTTHNDLYFELQAQRVSRREQDTLCSAGQGRQETKQVAGNERTCGREEWRGEERGSVAGHGPVPEADAEGVGLAVGVARERVDAPLREPRRRLHAATGHGPPRRRHRRHHLIDAAQQPQRLLPQPSSSLRSSSSSCTAAPTPKRTTRTPPIKHGYPQRRQARIHGTSKAGSSCCKL